MNPIISGKLRLLLELCLFGSIAGIVFQLLHEGLVDFRAFIIGVPLGGAFGLMELFVLSGFKKRFLKLPLILSILIKAIIYVSIINLITGLLALFIGALQGQQMEEFYALMVSKEQLILNIYTLLLFVSFSFYIQINRLLGQGVLLKFLLGKYRKPTGEHRIFMFLDIKSSTTLAEKLAWSNTILY